MRIDITKDRKLAEGLTTAEIRKASYSGAPDIDYRLVGIFALLRKWAGNKPIRLNSAYRNYIPKNGSKVSAHLRGNAFDLGMSSIQIAELKKTLPYWFPEAYSLGLRGLGIYSTFIHIDVEDQYITSDWRTPDGKTYPLRHWGVTWLTRVGPTKGRPDYDPSASVALPTPEEKKIVNAEVDTDIQHSEGWRKYFPYLLGLGLFFALTKS